MTQTIYGLISDSGDGSSCMHWYRTLAEIEYLLDEENGQDSYWACEGGPSETLTFPADLDLTKCGFYFCTIDED